MQIQSAHSKDLSCVGTPKARPGKGHQQRKRSKGSGPSFPISSPPAGIANAGPIASQPSSCASEFRPRSSPIAIPRRTPTKQQRGGSRASPTGSQHRASPTGSQHRSSPASYAGAKFSESPSAKELPPPPVQWVINTMIAVAANS